MIRDNGSGENAGAMIMFSTESNKSAGLSGTVQYAPSLLWFAGARVRLSNFDGCVSDLSFSGGINNYDIRIESVRILGSSIQVAWQNLNVVNRTVNARMRWYVWRGSQVNA